MRFILLCFLLSYGGIELTSEIIQVTPHVSVPFEKTQFSVHISTKDIASFELNSEVFRYDLLSAFYTVLRTRTLVSQKNAITTQMAHKWVFNQQTISIDLISFSTNSDTLFIRFQHAISATNASAFMREAEFRLKYSSDISISREQRYLSLISQATQQFASEYCALFLTD